MEMVNVFEPFEQVVKRVLTQYDHDPKQTGMTLAHYRSRQPVQTPRPIQIDADPKADQSPRQSKPDSSHIWEVCLPVWGPVVGRLSLVELVTHLV